LLCPLSLYCNSPMVVLTAFQSLAKRVVFFPLYLVLNVSPLVQCEAPPHVFVPKDSFSDPDLRILPFRFRQGIGTTSTSLWRTVDDRFDLFLPSSLHRVFSQSQPLTDVFFSLVSYSFLTLPRLDSAPFPGLKSFIFFRTWESSSPALCCSVNYRSAPLGDHRQLQFLPFSPPKERRLFPSP